MPCEVVRVGDAVAAVAISNLALLVGLFGMYILARDRLSDHHARRGILYLVLSPYAFALAMAYSEGLFLALATWVFVFLDRRRDMAACRSRSPRASPGSPAWPSAPLALPGVAAPHLRLGSRSPSLRWPRSRPTPRGLDHAVGIRSRWCTPSAVGAGTRRSRRWSSTSSSISARSALHVFFLIVGVTFIAYLALLIPILRRDIFAKMPQTKSVSSHRFGANRSRRRIGTSSAR